MGSQTVKADRVTDEPLVLWGINVVYWMDRPLPPQFSRPGIEAFCLVMNSSPGGGYALFGCVFWGITGGLSKEVLTWGLHSGLQALSESRPAGKIHQEFS